LDREAILRAKEALIGRYGDWTAHNIRLGEDLFTRDSSASGDEWRVLRVRQLVHDLIGPISGLRVLDLGCLEGLYAIEFALQGAEVVAIEGREANIEKARFAKETLALDKLELIQDDVRNLSAEEFGSFDLVLCIGLLYHLDAPDVFVFLEQLGSVCTRLAIVDTHIALAARATRDYRGRQYAGLSFVEHSPAASDEEREQHLWASLDNIESFWPTEPLLLRALSKVGFTTIAEVKLPAQSDVPADRVTYAALKGEPVRLMASTQPDRLVEPTEQGQMRRFSPQSRWYPHMMRLRFRIDALIRKLRR
jgi:SAM-dependent methyltransferase